MDIADEPLQDNCIKGRPLQQKKIYTLKKTIFSSAEFLLAAAVVISFAMVIFFALFFLKELFNSAADNAVIAEKPRIVDSHNAVLPDTDRIAPAVKTEAETAPGNFPAPGETKMPPAAGSSVSPINAEGNSYKDVSKGFIPKNFFAKQKNYQFMHQEKPAPMTGKISHIGRKSQNPAPMAKEISQTERKSPSITIKKLKNKSEVKKIETFKKIESLAADLDEAFREKNNKKTDRLLTELIRMIARKNNKADYYFKLMAFKLIRKKRYDAAKRFLNKVLAKNKNDFEAGINMAVIEIRQQKYSAAKKRLIKLKDMYPSHKEVDTLLNQL